jgi:hypothetical protein
VLYALQVRPCGMGQYRPGRDWGGGSVGLRTYPVGYAARHGRNEDDASLDLVCHHVVCHRFGCDEGSCEDNVRDSSDRAVGELRRPSQDIPTVLTLNILSKSATGYSSVGIFC